MRITEGMNPELVLDPFKRKLNAEYKKYLSVRKSRKADKGVTVSFRKDVVFIALVIMTAIHEMMQK